MNKPVRIGTRASRLALAQSGQIRSRLARLHPDVRFTLVKIKTAGDEFKGVELFRQTGIGVFTKAIEKKLLSGEIDLAVHSLKDVPTAMPKGLILAAVPKRESTRDALVSGRRYTLKTLPRGARVGTGSSRRAAQIRLRRPDVEVRAIRGNLDTRVAKALKNGELDAVVLAEAGLRRIKRYGAFRRAISETDMLPAVGQGALALQSRADDTRVRRLVAPLNDAPTARLVEAERIFLGVLGGGCRVPVGVSSRISGGRVQMTGAVFSTRSAEEIRGTFRVPAAKANAAAGLLAKQLLSKGARRLLREARS
jgi:hydroxymethylbilane synthase